MFENICYIILYFFTKQIKFFQVNNAQNNKITKKQNYLNILHSQSILTCQYLSSLEMDNRLAIGIDFGTSKACVAVYINGQIKIIPNKEKNLCTPSYVTFTDKEELVGDAARVQALLNAKNTFFDVKRVMAREFDKNWPFEIKENEVLLPNLIKDLGERKDIGVEEIYSIIFKK